MALTLSSSDLARLQAAQEVLLSPLDFPDPSEWCTTALGLVERIFQADRSMFVLPLEGRIRIFSESLDPWVLAAFEKTVKEAEARGIRFKESSLDAGERRRSLEGIEIYTNAQIDRMSGGRLFCSPFYHDVLEPAGVVHGSAVTTALPRGDARLCVAHSRAELDPFGESDGLELLSLLLPAFKAGVHARWFLQARRVSLASTLDHMAGALLVVEVDGREVHRSRALRCLLEGDAEGDDLLLAMQRLASQLCLLRRPTTRTACLHPTAVGEMQVRTSSHAYTLRGGYLAPGAFGRMPVALVSLERRMPELPTEESLRERYELTGREAEVTRLLALGLSNREIAQRLTISPHTVRTHAQHVFQKLNVHTRKALALRLLEAWAEG